VDIQLERRDSFFIVTIHHRLDANTAFKLRDLFARWLIQNPDRPRFIFDMTHVDIIDSTGLGALIWCLKQAANIGGDVRLSSVPEKARMIFSITRTERVFKIFETLDEAIA